MTLELLPEADQRRGRIDLHGLHSPLRRSVGMTQISMFSSCLRRDAAACAARLPLPVGFVALRQFLGLSLMLLLHPHAVIVYDPIFRFVSTFITGRHGSMSAFVENLAKIEGATTQIEKC